ncbi:MAG: peptidylprolyl isomerase [Ignavibacteria bacterium]|jgi:peptidylprolyl isomerase|nr:peptidylprolyl isomerase [Ignavibacteria bacterium]
MTAQDGSTVKIHYCGKLATGEVFDDSRSGEPLQFTIGANQVIAGFENGIKGMKIGEKKELFIPCEDAYGQPSDDYILELPKKNLPEDLEYNIGGMMQLQLAPELNVTVEIIQINEDSIVFDANHKLAGLDLIFEVELVDIVKSNNEQEVS